LIKNGKTIEVIYSVVTLILLIIIIAAFLTSKQAKYRDLGNKDSSPDLQPFLRGPGLYDFDIVGESYYQDALEEICGSKTIEGHRKEVMAILIHEDNNPKDDKAIRVDIEGMTVGHLERKFAREYRKRLSEAGYPGLAAACNALINGGWRRDASEGHFGVKLDLPRKQDLLCPECNEWMTTRHKKCPHCGNRIEPV
jgi:hypothetical protein